MTKEELKALVSSKIARQGNAVDVSGSLPTILNELIDNMGGGDAPSVIDLGEVEDSPTEVTDKIPAGYKPKSGDAINSNGIIYQFAGGIQLNDGRLAAIFGITGPLDAYNYIHLVKADSEHWLAFKYIV